MRKRFVLITGRHDDAFHRTARGRFASERDATAFAEQARRRGEFDWWMVAELDGERIAESTESIDSPKASAPPGWSAGESEQITTTVELDSHGFLIPMDSSSAPS